ncbi:MAG: amino acid adenylation domain-containing protein [Thermoanaerobaculia bacterium]
MTRTTDGSAPRHDHPLSPAQRRLWLLERTAPGEALYNLTWILEIEGALDPGRLARALARVAVRHGILRTTLVPVDGEPVQRVAPRPLHRLTAVDLRGLPEARRVPEADRLARRDEERPFDLAQGPLLRTTLIGLGPDEHRLQCAFHHTVADGWSLRLFSAEVEELYAALEEGRPPRLPALARQYTDHARRRREEADGDAGTEALAHWRRHLRGAPERLDLLGDRPRPKSPGSRAAWAPVALGPGATDCLAALGRRADAGLFATVFAAVFALLHCLSGEEDLVSGFPTRGRDDPADRELIGLFVRTLPLRARVSPETPFQELLAQVRDAVAGAVRNDAAPFARIVEALRPQRSLGHTPLFQVMFVLQNRPLEDVRLPGGQTVRHRLLEHSAAKFDLTFNLTPDPAGPGGLLGGIEYRTDLFEPTTGARLARRLEALLDAVGRRPEAPVGELPALLPGERHQVLVEWARPFAGTAHRRPPEATFPELLDGVLAERPDAVAVAGAERTLTYAGLAAEAERLAGRLRASGCGPGALAALALRSSADAVVAMVAVLRARAAFLPVDPDGPPERVAFIAEDAGASVVVTGGREERALPFPEEIPRMDVSGGAGPPEPAGTRWRPALPGELAYVIYTSGSTGVPKGVAVTHGSLARFAAAYAGALGLQPGRRALQFSSLEFDASVLEVFPTLRAGGTVCTGSSDDLVPGEPLAAFLARCRVTHFLLVPSVLACLPQDVPLPDLEVAATGGEACPPELAEAWRRRTDAGRLVNAYGPTEVTVAATLGEAGPERRGRWPSIGRTLAPARLRIVDRELRPAPTGVPGELCVGGPGLARGYLRRPGLTAERFAPDPTAGAPEPEPGARLYRTGDLARWLPDGRVEFLGRLDHQVKIRGVRIELGEVEACLAEHPAVAEAAAAVHRPPDRPELLAGYVVPREDAPGPAELRTFLAERLPSAVVPAAITVLEELPRTPGGKLDRRALPLPDRDAAARPGRIAPRTAAEKLVAGVWSEVLGLQPSSLGVDDRFFELGGHSLLAARTISRIRPALGVELPFRALLDDPSLGLLARRVEERREEAGREGVPHTGKPEPGEAEPAAQNAPDGPVELPLSFAQERLWLLDRFEGGGRAYVIPEAFRLRGSLAAGALARALATVVRRHEVLRTRFVEDSGEPRQEVGPVPRCVLPLVDLRRLPGARHPSELARLRRREARRRFDLARGPLLRALLVRSAPEEHELLLSVHHAASDGWSQEILHRELEEVYGAAVEGRTALLPEPPIQFADYAAWQRDRLASGELDEGVRRRAERLAGIEPLELPADRPRPPLPSYRGAIRSRHLPEAVWSRVAALGARQRATPFMTLLAGVEALLFRHAGQERFAVGVPTANRNQQETEDLIGFFVDMLVLPAEITGRENFPTLLERTRDAAVEAYEDAEVPFDRLVQELQPERDPSRTPLFQVACQLLAPSGPPDLLGLTVEGVDVENGTAKFDLELTAREAAEGLRLRCEHSLDLFEPPTVERLLGHLENLLAAAADAPERPVAELPLLAPPERHQLVVEWNDRPAHLEEILLHRAVRRRASEVPDAVAVAAGGVHWTYRELLRRADALARRLERAAPGPETPVGLHLGRSPELAAAVLSVLETGGCFVPLDPEYPPGRLQAMVEDSGAPVVVTLERHAEELPAAPGTRTLLLDRPEGAGGGSPDPGSREDEGDPRRLAYILYTSGSTGRPKGVACSHRGVVNLLADFRSRRPLGPGQRCAWWTSPSFDVSIYELFSALLAGGTLHPVPEESRLDGQRLAAWLRRVRIESAYVPPFALPDLAGDAREGGPLTLRRLLVGVEPIDEVLLADLRASTPGLAVINGYGPTEATVCATLYDVPAEPAGRERTPIGRPVQNGRVLLLGPESGAEPVPLGVPGETHLGGPGLARGYHGRPARTAEAFVPDPWAETPGARVYRTGDQARHLPGGDLLFLGRRDHQVKVRGMRIELGEVEAVLARHPAVRRAVARVVETAGGEPRLVAYAVPRPGAWPGAEELRTHARRDLPDPMVPAAFRVLESLPQTPSGKLDLRALPEPSWDLESSGPPRTETERIVASIWSAALNVPRPGRRDDFFGLGGHSLLATRVLARIREVLGVDLPLRTFFRRSTLDTLSAAVDEARRAGHRRLPPIRPVPRDRELPLSFSQLRQWFLVELAPDSPAYNLPLALRLEGDLDRPCLARSLEAVVERHEVLRTSFHARGGQPRQSVQPPPAVPLPVVDLSGLPERLRSRALEAGAAARSDRPFDLARAPLLRPVLFALDRPGADHLLLIAIHHIVFDGWSFEVLARDLAELYRARSRGEAPDLEELPVQYADYAHWQRRELAPAAFDEQLAFWRGCLAGADDRLALPTDRPRPARPGHDGDSELLVLPRPVADGVRRLADETGATPFMVLLAAFQVLLARHAGQEDVLVGTFVANRRSPEIERLIGFFVNTLVLRGDLAGAPGFRAFLERVREGSLEAFDHQDLPFEDLLDALGVERDPSRTPLFQAMFGMLNFATAEARVPGLTVRGENLRAAGRTDADLALWTWESEGGSMKAWLQYRTALFDRVTAMRLLRRFEILIRAAVEDPERSVRNLPVLTQPERHQAIREWDAPFGRPGVDAETVLDRIEAWGRRRPDAVAVVAGSRTLTYGALLARARALAGRLARAVPAGPETTVAVRLERSPELIEALLGILRTGSAYLPLDDAAPPDRLDGILADARATGLVSRDREGSPLGGGLRAARRAAGTPEAGGPNGGPVPEALAYVVYTSGTTGVPKGVGVSHRALLGFLRSAAERYALGPGDRVLQFSSVAFDASVEEIFGALASGATLVLRDEATLTSAARFFADCARWRITVADLPTAWWHELAAEAARGRAVPEALRLVIIGGEAAQPGAVADWASAGPVATLVNTYGPTEATVVTTAAELEAPGERRVPIGRPLAGAAVHVTDQGLRPAVPGTAGELVIGGAGLARGYLGRPGLTAEHFVPDPWSGAPGARLYRSGDLVRHRSDGVLEFLARIDHQVKVRGHRVEPDGVAAVVAERPDVRNAAVVPWKGADGSLRLVAYVVPEGAAPPSANDLRSALRSRLPAYMVPAELVTLDELPLTPTGKVDRDALPEPGGGERAAETYVPPETPTEQALAEIWRELLEVERVGVHDDFFELGGHSLLAPQLVARIEEDLALELPLAVLFQASTLGELAAAVEELLIEELEGLSDEEAEALLDEEATPVTF